MVTIDKALVPIFKVLFESYAMANFPASRASGNMIKNNMLPFGLSKILNKTVGGTGSPTVFRVGLKSIPVNFTDLFNSTKGMNGAQCYLSVTAQNISIAAGNLIRVEGMTDLGTDVDNNQTDDDLLTVMTRNMRIYQMKSSSPFMAVPFVALLRNGESVTATDVNGYLINQAVGSACGTETRIIAFGPIAASKLQLDAGNQYTAGLGVDFTSLWNAYAVYHRKKQLASEEATRMEMFTGIAVVGSASQTINCTLQNGAMSYKKDFASIESALSGGI